MEKTKKSPKSRMWMGSVGAFTLAGILVGGVAVANAGPNNDGRQADEIIAGVAKVDPQTGDKVAVDTQKQVIKDLGDKGKLTKSGSTKPLFEISVNKVTKASSCKVRGFGNTVKPKNGTFLIVDVTATLNKSANKEVNASEAWMPLDASVFGTSSGIGKKANFNLATEEAFGCELAKPLEFAVAAGDTVKGQVMLDSSVTKGQLVYDPERTGGWTWAF